MASNKPASKPVAGKSNVKGASNGNPVENKAAEAAASKGAEQIKGVEKAGGAETIQTAEAPKKTHIANEIFKEMYGREQVPQRKDMIKAAMEKAGISQACAATYLQNFKRKNGLQKDTAPAA